MGEEPNRSEGGERGSEMERVCWSAKEHKGEIVEEWRI